MWQRIQDWKLVKWLRNLEGAQLIAMCMLLGSVILMALGYVNQNLGWSIWEPLDTWLHDFYANVSAEMASIGITVLVIDAYNERRAIAREKADLILQMGSPDNGFALEAVRKLRARSWLKDGSLHNADLQGANLQKANLTGADLSSVSLEGADIRFSILESVRLDGANLTQTNLREVNITVALSMRSVNLQGVDFDMPPIFAPLTMLVRVV